MKRILLATSSLVLLAAAPASNALTPGPGGQITDAAGNVWTLTASGSIQENGQWTPGGGGTAALEIVNGLVYGEDGHGRGWFTLSTDGQYWSQAAAPVGIAVGGTTPEVQAGSQPATGTAPTVSASSQPGTVAPACSATAAGAASSGFTTANGQIYGPDGQPFVARGIDVYDSAMGSAGQILQDFPGINFIRLAAYSYQSPSAYRAFIDQMTAAHVVVEIEHHVGAGGGVPPLSGGDLASEDSWFSSLASAFKTNPYVWFGTINEPDDSGGNAGVLANEMASNYAAIRSAGDNAIILLSVGGKPPAVNMSNMTNVAIDQHYYGWVSGYSTDQATVNARLNELVTADQQQSSATGKPPVIIGEYGPATDGTNNDPNGSQVIAAVTGSGLGSAAWNFDSDAQSDNLTLNGAMTSFGDQVAGYFALTKDAAPSIWASSCTTSTLASNAPAGTTVANVVAPSSPVTSDSPPPAPQSDQAQLAAAEAEADSAAQAGQTDAANVTAQTTAAVQAAIAAHLAGGQ